MTDLRMWWFHVGQFARNGYFTQLLVTTTVGLVALQALAARASDDGQAWDGWIRAGMVGTWTVCTVAAGMIGYQRFQGTLVHLLRSPLAAPRVLMPVVGAGSVFGLAAFPLAAVCALIMRQPVVSGPVPAMAASWVVFWLAAFSISAVIGTLFVLTPNAMTYEGLLAVPLVLASGVFGTPAALPTWVTALTHVLPTTSAVDLMLGLASGTGGHGTLLALESVTVSTLWLVVAHRAAIVVARRTTVTGSMEVV
jgi:ABC-2 type transport system permease protein